MRRFQRDEEGQASVIGTILAIMVFLAFLSLITTQYIPLSMAQYEAEHIEESKAQFISLRQAIDNQILTDEKTFAMYSPLTLGSRSVPVFTTPTIGQLSFNPYSTGISVSFNCTSDGQVNETSSGSFRLYVPNRYIDPVYTGYESAALLKRQDEGQLMDAAPHFNVIKQPGNASLNMQLIDMVGKNTSVADMGTTGIRTQLEYADTWTFVDPVSTIYINVTTLYTQAWGDFFNETMSEDFDTTDYNITIIPTPDRDTPGSVNVEIYVGAINYMTLGKATIFVTIGSET